MFIFIWYETVRSGKREPSKLDQIVNVRGKFWPIVAAVFFSIPILAILALWALK
jgi:hypothetical protein